MRQECSVIIPAFNSEQYLADAIESVLCQEVHFDIEIIVIDDGSSDSTPDIARQYGGRIRLLQKRNGGPGSARNTGALAANSDLLVFLDADDRMLPGRLARQVGFMLEHPEVALTFGAQSSQPISDLEQNGSFEILDPGLPTLLVKGARGTGGSTMAVRRAEFMRVGMMREDVHVGEDYDLVCKISAERPIARTSSKLIWCRRGHPSLTNSVQKYYGPARVLFENLIAYQHHLTDVEFHASIRQFLPRVRALLLYEWATNGRSAAGMRLDEFRSLLPAHFRLFWSLARFGPRSLGRLLQFGYGEHVTTRTLVRVGGMIKLLKQVVERRRVQEP